MGMNVFTGLDPSLTGTGIVNYIPNGHHSVDSHVVGSSPSKGIVNRMWRYDKLLGQIMDLLPEEVSGVAIEGYSFGSKGQGIIDRAEFGGLLRHWLVTDKQFVIVEVPPATLKLFVCGKGGGPGTDKAGVRLATYKRWGVEFDNDNECDAYVLARIAACHWGAEEPATDFQRRALAKLS